MDTYYYLPKRKAAQLKERILLSQILQEDQHLNLQLPNQALQESERLVPQLLQQMQLEPTRRSVCQPLKELLSLLQSVSVHQRLTAEFLLFFQHKADRLSAASLLRIYAQQKL